MEFRVVNTVFSGFNTSDCGYHSYAMASSPGEVDFSVPVTGTAVMWDQVDDSARFFLATSNSRPLFIDKDGSLLGAYGGGAGSSLIGNGAWAEPTCGFVDVFNGLVCKGQVYRTGSYVNIDMRNQGSPGKLPLLEADSWSSIDVQRLTSPFAPRSTPRNAITYTLDTGFG